MKHALLRLLLGLVVITSLALSGCRTSKRLTTTGRQQAEPTAQAVSTDATPPVGVVVQPPRTLLDKLTGRIPKPQHYPPGTPVRAGKKSTITINHVAGNQSNQANTAGKNAAAGTGATTGGKADGPVAGTGADLDYIEKAKAPVATGTGDASDYTKQGQRGGAAASGAGAIATATTVKKSLWSYLLPIGALTGFILLVWWLVAGGGALWLAARKRKSADEPRA